MSVSPAAGQHVSIQVPSAYVSQQAPQLEVALVRTAPGRAGGLGPLTVSFSASPGTPPVGNVPVDSIAQAQIIPVTESVTFPAGVTTENVAVPINYSGGPKPALVPVELAVNSSSRGVRGSDAMINLADDQSAVPPSIVAVQRVAGGIAVTFSKPMDPATVADIHNYAVQFAPSQQFNLEDLTGFGLVQTLDTTKSVISLRRASYDAATNTVTLVPNEQLGPNGAYIISNAPSLLAKKNRPHKAHALSDLQGNALSQGANAPGVFSIRIGKGHPYSAATPGFSNGS
jgi:hypothetical protein